MATKQTNRLTAKPLGDVDKHNRIDLKPQMDSAPSPLPIPGRSTESAINLISFSVQVGAASRRPVILIDEAQGMTPAVLCELRLLASANFDSQSLLCVVLAGDARSLDKLRREELIPLGSRIRTRLATGVATRDELLACLDHLLTTAGNASLMTQELRHTLCDHAAGNYRICIAMAAELLMTAAQRDITVLDEKRYLQVFAQPQPQGARRAASAR